MFNLQYGLSAGAAAAAGLLAWSGVNTHAQTRSAIEGAGRVKTVFVIAMETHNWTQPATQTSPQQVFLNPYAPFINSLVDGSSAISSQVAYATNYINSGVGVHPSEPNYFQQRISTRRHLHPS